MPLLLTLLLCLGMTEAAEANDAPALFTADGYRQALYRSPTPPSVDGAQTLDTPGLRQLLERHPHTALIDVYRRQWLFGQFIEDQPHANLPGSVWLANTGDGVLTPDWASYFTSNLKRLSHSQAAWPLVFYCRSDCWLGWNAARRAHAMGYTNLYWYRDGVDAWEQAGLALHPAQPEPLAAAPTP